ncbi:MAG: hypothetical protein R3242_02530 [Akkermansiaceae bacterium]|nr:hypothetical protein [Akkermansiaceae bacterium]
MNDLFGSEEGKAIARDLFPLLVEELKQHGDKLNLQKSYPGLWGFWLIGLLLCRSQVHHPSWASCHCQSASPLSS